MEPRDRAAETLNDPATVTRSRVRLAAASLVLVGLALVQDPGFLVPDTKFDLVEAPVGFLGRALHLWDAQGAFGQLQNQAYGYLWPMGPFFALGHVAALPGWLVQRLWLALVLVVALVGAVKLVRALGVRSDLAALVAGIAFALSPRMLTDLGPISIEAWPSAVAPWVLLALVHGSRSGSPRRWAALAGFAVAMVGGVNAAATFAVIPLGVVWLLTRSAGPRRRSLMLWWPVFTVLGTLWWLVPLFVMGSYSPPFLDFIETTAVTTFPTNLWDVLRGTSNWVPYIDPSSRAGNDLITTPYLILNSGLVLLAGFAGLMLRRTPERAFLTLGVLVGVLMVGAGHRGPVEGWFAGDVRGLLDGALAPLRNVHKYDVVLRLPLVVGVAHALDQVVARRDEGAEAAPRTGLLLAQGNRVAVTALVVLAVAGSVLPAGLGRITPSGAVLTVPDYWRQTAAWLGDHDDGTALVVPGAPFASYVWGSPQDEPLQYFASSAWAVRNVIPLAPTGNIRMLDEIESRLVEGAGSPGLTAYLRRAGVHYVVVRNDVATNDDVPVPVVVHQALRQSGLGLVATFGPQIGGGADIDTGAGQGRVVVNGGWQDRYPAVEVYEVPDASGPAVTAGDPPVVVGGPEDLLDLQQLGVVGDEPTQLAADRPSGAAPPDQPVVLTDGLRARERSFARIHDGYSATLTPGDVRRTANPARDYAIADGDRWSTTVRLGGASAISASSSQSDSDAAGGAIRGQLPYAAVDGSRTTQWVSAVDTLGSPWWQVDLTGASDPGEVSVTGGPSAPDNQILRVVTAAGRSDPLQVGPGQTVRFTVPAGSTGWIRVEDASGTIGRRLALAEVSVAGLVVTRSLVTPRLPDGWPSPQAVVLRADDDSRTGCLEVDDDVRCVAGRDRTGEESTGFRRVVTLPEAATYAPSVMVVPRSGQSLDAIALKGQAIRAIASSSPVPDPRAGAVAAIDGDPGTTWMAAVDDLRPTLSLTWLGQFDITGIDLSVDDATAAQLPDRVRLTWPSGSRTVDLDHGVATFPAIRTDRLELRVDRAELTTDLGFDTQRLPIGVGIGELRLTGLPYTPLRLSLDRRTTACGAGPQVEVDGTTYDTFVDASPVELLRRVPVPATLCDPASASPRQSAVTALTLRAGENDVSVVQSRAFQAASLVLTRPDASTSATPVRPAGVTGTSVARRVTPSAAGGVLELHQNENAGWQARQGGRTLQPVVLDGWQQGWRLDDASPVTATFAPDGPYRIGLLGGLLGLLALAALVLAGLRRTARPAPPPALAARRLPAPVGAAALVFVAGMSAGWVGVAVALVGAVAAVGLARRAPEARAWVLAVPCLVVAAAFALSPWGSVDGWAGQTSWPDYVMLLPLAGLVVAASSAPRTRLLSRSAGRSSSR